MGNFFEFFIIIFFCFVFAIFDLVHDVEAIFHLPCRKDFQLMLAVSIGYA